MNTEQQKLLIVRVAYLNKAIKELHEASKMAFDAMDFRACDKIRELRRSVIIELRIAEHDVQKIDLF